LKLLFSLFQVYLATCLCASGAFIWHIRFPNGQFEINTGYLLSTTSSYFDAVDTRLAYSLP